VGEARFRRGPISTPNNAPSSLDGTKVTFDGKSAFIDYISPGHVTSCRPIRPRGAANRP
jgi:uncharacterized protein (TIGR03437 family)